jgi:D-alanyl-lipoteichoic acid acyltransferase DltB (MBOAT superfamily)
MAFHSWQFGLLLATTLVLYWLCAGRRALRTWLLLGASVLYYGAFEPWFLWLIAFSTLLDYGVGLWLARDGTPRGRRLALLASLVGNLGLLGHFKYSAWVADLLQPLQDALGTSLPLRELAWHDEVPVGISFYTFQTLSYTLDVYRGVLPAQRSLRDFSFFVAFFPQLVAGPIVRAKDFLPQLEHRPWLDHARLHDGLWRIAIGLAKKTLLADVIGRALVDPVHANPGAYAAPLHLVAVYAFAFQIYCDFSGYSDIAIGSARLFGFDLLENFDAPYRARSIREFWRRWHISLSSWVRDYLFHPLGGSRGSEGRVARNLMVTLVVIGLWHGASTLWLLYGVSQGLALVFERWRERAAGGPFATTPARGALAWLAAFHFTALTCILIRAADLEAVGALLGSFGDAWSVDPWGWVALAGAVATHFLPDRLVDALRERVLALPTPALGAALGLLLGALFLVIHGETPFIYFQF